MFAAAIAGMAAWFASPQRFRFLTSSTVAARVARHAGLHIWWGAINSHRGLTVQARADDVTKSMEQPLSVTRPVSLHSLLSSQVSSPAALLPFKHCKQRRHLPAVTHLKSHKK
jgi:hypothetical protein